MIESLIRFHIYSGDMAFTGLALLAVAVIGDRFAVKRESEAARRIARLLFLLSLPLIALAGIAIPIWLAAAGLAAWAIHAYAAFGRKSSGRTGWSAALLLGLGIVVLSHELWWRLPVPGAARVPGMIIVFGDSLSAGGFEETRTWVELLEERSGFSILDLSRASATTASALRHQLPEVPKNCGGCGVVIELGGNDMLDHKGIESYERNMRLLLNELTRRGVTRIWMVEFPVLPGGWRWAAAQRRLARDARATLIPKRVLARALLTPGSTLDGLHLSDRGHALLARELVPWLGAARR